MLTGASADIDDRAAQLTGESLYLWPSRCEHGGKACDPRGNFVVWDDFLKAIKISNKIEVTTLADVYSGGTVSAGCEIKLRDWVVAFPGKRAVDRCDLLEAWHQRAATTPVDQPTHVFDAVEIAPRTDADRGRARARELIV